VAVAVVKFESGALGVIHATTAAYPGLSARVQIHGDKGSVVIDNDELAYIHRAAYAGDQRDVSYGANSTSDNQKDTLDLPEKGTAAAGRDPGQLSDAHRAQYLNILAALQGREKLRVDLETNRQAISVITGAYESARTGKPVVLS
jgi:predicted dehydrogenase